MIKQSFCLTTASGRKLHIISYYNKRDLTQGLLSRLDDDDRFTSVQSGGAGWPIDLDLTEYPHPDEYEMPIVIGPEGPNSIDPTTTQATGQVVSPETNSARKRPWDHQVEFHSAVALDDPLARSTAIAADTRACSSLDGYGTNGYAAALPPKSSYVVDDSQEGWYGPDHSASLNSKRLRVDSAILMSQTSNDDGMRPSLSTSTTSTDPLTGSSDAEDFSHHSHRQSLMVASRWPSQATLVPSSFGTGDEPRSNYTKSDQSPAGLLLNLAQEEGPKGTLSASS